MTGPRQPGSSWLAGTDPEPPFVALTSPPRSGRSDLYRVDLEPIVQDTHWPTSGRRLVPRPATNLTAFGPPRRRGHQGAAAISHARRAAFQNQLQPHRHRQSAAVSAQAPAGSPTTLIAVTAGANVVVACPAWCRRPTARQAIALADWCSSGPQLPPTQADCFR